MATILIVDDRRDAEKILNRFLTDQGFDVMSLNSAVDLINTLEVSPVDAIVMDLNMPDVDGCEATQMLREHESLKNTPVVLCTADPLPGDQDRALASGCNAFLEKPISKETLCETLAKLLSNCECRTEAASVSVVDGASSSSENNLGDGQQIAVA